MKKIEMKIRYFLAATFLVAVFTVGCTKDGGSGTDPNIISKTYNVSLTNTTSLSVPDQQLAFDIDGNGSPDYIIEASFQNAGGDTTITTIELKSFTMDNELMVENYVFPGGQTATKLKSLANGSIINGGLLSDENGFAVLSAKKGLTTLGDFGFTDGSDKLIGFSFYIGSSRHYGWLKINVSADLKTLTVKDGAYHKTANTEIGAGDK